MDNMPSKAPSSRDEISRLSEIIIEVQKAFKALNYYQEGHPALYELTSNTYKTIIEKMENIGSTSVSVKRRGFFSGYHLIGKGIKPLEGFARDLYTKGVRRIFLLKGLSQKDFDTFVRTVHLPPKELLDGGGIESLLSERGVKTIWINEINYDRLVGKDLSYRGETDEVALRTKAEEENLGKKISPFAYGTEEALNLIASELTEGGAEMTLEKLLNELKGSISDKRYREIMGLMIPQVIAEISKGNLDQPIEVLQTLSGHLDSSSHMLAEKEGLIIKAMREMALPPVLKHLVDKLCGSQGEDDSTPILLKIGEPSLDPILDAMAETSNMRTRKLLASTIEKFGSRASEKVKAGLGDARWFVVRNMASILGDIGAREEIIALEDLFRHSDMRVKKEAVKALARIGGKEGARALIAHFEEAEKELQRIILFDIGILEEPATLPFLLKVVHKKGLFAGDPDLRKEAIMALGRLGMEGALPALEEMLTNDHFFSREKGDIRLASAWSLAAIGSEKAVAALTKGAASNNEAVKKECERLLTARK